MMTTGPIITSSWLIADTLAWLKDVLQFSIQDLIVDNTRLHIYYNSSRFKICDRSPSLEINLTILSRINISEETAQGFIIYKRFIVGSMLSQGQFPES